MINTNILQRVFFVKYWNNVWTAFTIEVNNKQYLISAKHIFSWFDKSDNIEIFHQNQRKKILVEAIFCDKDTIDIIAFKLPLQISPKYEIIPSFGNIILSQDVFFLWFPYSFAAPDFELNRWFPFPIVKKWILSAMWIKDEYWNELFLIDWHNNKWFSWWPVVFFENNSRKLHIWWVISWYYIDQKDIQEQTKFIQENSWLFYGYSIKYIVDVLSRIE